MGRYASHRAIMAPTGYAYGLNKGKVVTKTEKKTTPAQRRGKLGKKTKFVRDIIREVAGFAPYERRMMELLKNGKEKRALKVAKQRLGTHKRQGQEGGDVHQPSQHGPQVDSRLRNR